MLKTVVILLAVFDLPGFKTAIPMYTFTGTEAMARCILKARNIDPMPVVNNHVTVYCQSVDLSNPVTE